MRIVDKRKDYYDGVQRNGQDLTCVYVRKEQEIEIPEVRYIKDRTNSGRYTIYEYAIGFCGEIYNCLHLVRYDYGTPQPVKNWWVYSVEDTIKILGKPSKSRWYKGKNWIEEFFERRPQVLLDLFREYKVPIFIVHPSFGWADPTRVTLNPLLNQYEFQKVVDPYTAFQKIHSFMSGVLGPEPKPIPEIDDETRVAIHGFNEESFRSQPGTKPNRKRKKQKR